MNRLLAALTLLLPMLAQAGYDDAVQAYAAGDYSKALAEFRTLADQGDTKSQYFVGFLYRHGYGVPVDNTEAAKWFLKAAEKGDSLSQYYLGKMAESGEGMPKDLTLAHMWLSLSVKGAPNVRDAAYTRDDIRKLERKMSAAEIAKAKEMAQRWKPQQ